MLLVGGVAADEETGKVSVDGRLEPVQVPHAMDPAHVDVTGGAAPVLTVEGADAEADL